MSNKNKLKISILLLSLLGITSYFFSRPNFSDINFKKLTTLNKNQKKFIKRYLLPYKLITQQEGKISDQNKQLSLLEPFLAEVEYYKKLSLTDIGTEKSSVTLENGLNLDKFKLTSGFYSGIKTFGTGSGYIDFHEDNMFLLSSRGILSFTKEIKEGSNFKQIKNNIEDFIGLVEFKKNLKFSLKDLLIIKNKIFISYTEEISEDCWNTSVIYGDINYQNIKFKKLFSPTECINSSNNIDNEFEPVQSGGRMISFDDNNILLSIGDYRSRYLAQDKQSVNGKIIKINLNDSNFEIISMGIRNAQGLYFDRENNFILETEHGPRGGDEVNLIEVKNFNTKEIQNFGWPIASAGEHYPDNDKEALKKRYEKYPLYKSHSEYGFIEPLNSFVPSIGISEITKIRTNYYVLSSLRDNSLYFFELNNKRKIVNFERVEVFERIRDLVYKDNKIYMFMESTSSIGVINL